jgi:pyruvate dehydrogenase E2 component (dihydrolipoamide acetyltransferase)
MDIRLPNLGEGADSGTVTSILVKVGDTVERDQAIIELESEKAVASVPSAAKGRVTRIHVSVGDEIREGTLLVALDGSDEIPDVSKTSLPADETPAPPGPVESGETGSAPSSATASVTGHPPATSPSIRKVARELGIDLGRLSPTGNSGRIVFGDLRNYISALQALQSQPAISKPADFSRWGRVTTLKATPLRKIIAARMSESWSSVPHVTQFIDADITSLMEHRRKYVPLYKEREARLTLTPLVLKAVVLALKRHPLLNSSLDKHSESIVTKEYYHIGMAVDTDAGLVVPVIRDVDQKSVFELAREVEAISERARGRKISRDEMQGGTFTVSNQGGIGGTHFTPIINTPEVAILGIGRGKEGLRFREGKVEARIMLPLSLSHDHRVVDGADGVRFLVDLVETLEGLPESELKLT